MDEAENANAMKLEMQDAKTQTIHTVQDCVRPSMKSGIGKKAGFISVQIRRATFSKDSVLSLLPFAVVCATLDVCNETVTLFVSYVK